MRRTDAGLWLAAALAVFVVLFTVYWLGRAAWQSPQIRDVPATATPTVRVLVLPIASLTSTTLLMSTSTSEPFGSLPGPSTRVPPTATPTATIVPPTPDKPAVQRG